MRPDKYGYRSPSSPKRSAPTPFQSRKFWQVQVSPFEPHIKGGRRQWFSYDRAERRTFTIHYGYNLRCFHQGSWGKPGTFHWRRNR